jgi:hypothetical protein
MSCPHSLKSGPCSQCAGAVPQVVRVEGALVTVDGEPAGRAADQRAATRIDYARRGGKRRRPR